MTGKSIVSKLKKLDLPKDSYVVFGSCPMAAVGIRQSQDIDLLINDEALDIIKLEKWRQVDKGPNDKPYTKGVFEAHTAWDFSSYKPTLDHLLKTADIIDGIPFASLSEVRKWKVASGRPKDLVDIKLIDNYLKNKVDNKPTITICSSANFYRQSIDIQAQLEQTGCKVIVPAMAHVMKKTGDFNVDHYKTWFGNKSDYHKKTKLIRGHFNEVNIADAILVLNYEKHGVDNYIGGNVLMEMAIAFNQNKPIFILNEIPSKSSFMEEIIGLNPIVLHGKVETLLPKYKKLPLAV